MVCGDELKMQCTVETGAHCLLTNPSAGKVYRADRQRTPQSQAFSFVLNNAVCEWLPQENILFNGANAIFSSFFHLKGRSRLIAWDIACFGRHTAGESFEYGQFLQKTIIIRDTIPLVHEQLVMEANGQLWASPAGLQRKTVSATVYACGYKDDPRDAKALEYACARLQRMLLVSAKTVVTGLAGGQSGVTCRGGVLIARYLGHDSAAAKRFCFTAWRVIRPFLLGRRVCPPRIWNT
jgi:urease accessory protein